MAFSQEELNEFNAEALELLDTAEKSLLALDQGEAFSSHYDSIFRTLHNLKGAAGMMELTELQSHMHHLENVLTEFKGSEALPKNKIEFFLCGIDATRRILAGESGVTKLDPVPTPPPEALHKAPAIEPVAYALTDSSREEFFAECDDIFTRISQSLDRAKEIGANPELIDSIYRDMHSLKSCAFLMGHTDLGEVSHALESALDQLRDSPNVPTAIQVATIVSGTDIMERMVDSLKANSKGDYKSEIEDLLPRLQEPARDLQPKGPPVTLIEAASQEAHTDPEKQDASSTIRVPVALLDKLMTMVGEMVLVRNQVIQYSNKSDDLGFLNLSQRLNVVTGEIQCEMMKTRMQPIGNILSKFQRVVRDLSRDLQKKIELVIEGSETELDKTLLEAIKDPLTHIIRNSCDHGLETPEDRRNQGKEETGTIRIHSYHEGGQVIVEIADNGRGLHREKLISKALDKKLITPEKAASMSDRDAMNLIFAPGFSTAAQVTNVSGRGVGMDVVRSNVDRIGGTVELESAPNRGTTVRLKIPLTLAIVPAMIVRTGEDHYVIPQIKLSELVRVEKNDPNMQIEYLQGKPVFRLRGDLLPLLDLKAALNFENHDTKKFTDSADAVNIIVLNSERQSFGLIVDEILDTADIVVKPLSRFLKSMAVYSGATVLGDGSVALILDVAGIANQFLMSPDKRETNSIQSTRSTEKNRSLDETQEFLLFRLNSPTKHAVFLGYVHRLEEFKRSAIELSGNQRVVRYRNAILPINSMNETLGFLSGEEAKSDVVPVIVTQKGNQLFGIEVNEILDVYSTDASVDVSVCDRPAIFGNIVTENEVIVIVDPHQCRGHLTNPDRQQDSPSGPIAAAGVLPKLADQNHWAPGSKRILLVEDTAFFRKHVAGVLERAGYEVVSARNGEEGLTELEHRDPGYFSMVLSDIEMPKLNGYDLARTIRKDSRWRNLPLVALTTKSSPKDRETGMQAGYSAYLEKLNGEQLLVTLESFINKKEAA